MDYATEQNRAGWRSLLATALWIVVAAGGLSLIMPLQPILFGLGKLTMSGDVDGVVMDKYRIVSMRNFGLIAYGMLWLGGIIGLQPWLEKARNVRQLLTRFGTILGCEAAIWAIGYLVQKVAMV